MERQSERTRWASPHPERSNRRGLVGLLVRPHLWYEIALRHPMHVVTYGALGLLIPLGILALGRITPLIESEFKFSLLLVGVVGIIALAIVRYEDLIGCTALGAAAWIPAPAARARPGAYRVSGARSVYGRATRMAVTLSWILRRALHRSLRPDVATLLGLGLAAAMISHEFSRHHFPYWGFPPQDVVQPYGLIAHVAGWVFWVPLTVLPVQIMCRYLCCWFAFAEECEDRGAALLDRNLLSASRPATIGAVASLEAMRLLSRRFFSGFLQVAIFFAVYVWAALRFTERGLGLPATVWAIWFSFGFLLVAYATSPAVATVFHNSELERERSRIVLRTQGHGAPAVESSPNDPWWEQRAHERFRLGLLDGNLAAAFATLAGFLVNAFLPSMLPGLG